jgi:general secretion pathway protein C
MNPIAIPENIVQRLPLITGILIFALLALNLASSGNGIYQLMEGEEEQTSVEPLPPTSSASAPTRINYSSLISRKHLFGTSVVSKARIVDAPPSKLNLKLRGIFSTDDDTGAVIIADGSGQEDVYQIDDSLPGGARLVSIHTNYVIIERNQQMEKLVLPEDPSAFTLSNETPSLPSGAEPVSKASASKLGALRQELIKNPTSLGKLVSLSPSMNSSGQLEGYRIYPRGRQPLFDQLGLKAGDVVTRINGTQLNNSRESLAAIQKLMKATELNLTVLRNGETININQSLE